MNAKRKKEKRKLTEKQQATLDAIKMWIEANGQPPSRIDLSQALNVHASTVTNRIEALKAKGWIEVDKYCPRGIKLVE